MLLLGKEETQKKDDKKKAKRLLGNMQATNLFSVGLQNTRGIGNKGKTSFFEP